MTTDEEFKSKISPLKLVNETTAAECASASEACKRDLLKSRVNIIQYPANFPCEDRFDAVQFNKSNGYYTAVFDGHGGWQVSEYAMKYYKIRIENKVGIKLPLLRTGCVTGVTRFLITLFGFINWPNRNINGEIELANL